MVVVREITRAIVPCFLAARFNSGIKRLDDISCGLSAQVDLFNYNHLESRDFPSHRINDLGKRGSGLGGLHSRLVRSCPCAAERRKLATALARWRAVAQCQPADAVMVGKTPSRRRDTRGPGEN